MSTKVIKLSDEVDVEIEINENDAHEISYSQKVDSSLFQIETLLKKIATPFSNTYKELNKEMNVDSAKVTVGIKIGVEGNFILAKSNANANIQVEMILKPKDEKGN